MQVKVNGDSIGTIESYAGPIFDSFWIEQTAVKSVSLGSVGLQKEDWISLLEVGDGVTMPLRREALPAEGLLTQKRKPNRRLHGFLDGSPDARKKKSMTSSLRLVDRGSTFRLKWLLNDRATQPKKVVDRKNFFFA